MPKVRLLVARTGKGERGDVVEYPEDEAQDHCARGLCELVEDAEEDSEPGAAPIGATLGELRNLAIERAREWLRDAPGPRLAIQWDDDDQHHAERIERQVAVWRAGAAVVLRRQLRGELSKPGDEIVCDRTDGIEGTILHDLDTPHEYPRASRGEDTAFLKRFPLRVVLENDPRLYLRWFHGKNTWHRDHVLRPKDGRPASQELRRFVAESRMQYPGVPPALRYWHHFPSIEGWASTHCCRMLADLWAWRAEQFATHDPTALEIGVHHGRTLLALATATTRSVTAIDKWEEPERLESFTRHAAEVLGIGWSGSLETYRRDSSTIEVTELREAMLGARTLALAHIDGDHEGPGLLHDLQTVLEVSEHWTLIVLDDTANNRWPAVGATVWPWIERHGLFPVALIENRLVVAMREQHARETEAWLVEWLARHKLRVRRHRLANGREILSQ